MNVYEGGSFDCTSQRRDNRPSDRRASE